METLGGGCLVAAFGGFQVLSGVDNVYTGGQNVSDGTLHATTGGQLLQRTGLSPGWAELLYSGSQIGAGFGGGYAVVKFGPTFNSLDRGLGGANGHQFAANVTDGGSGQALAGHGVMDTSATVLGNGQYVSPAGTTVITPRPGITIADSTGRILENVTSVEHLESILSSGIGPNGEILRPRNFADLAGYNVISPGETGFNYTLLSPGYKNKPLNIFSKSTTTDAATHLSVFLKPNMGCVFWAACTQVVPYIPK
ncbi:hypothetical protein GEV01_04690 [Rugamonas sp. FT103W]|uniref:Putative adhesin Stv domain-containing protein n=2 Tax=Rugamonas rivuli TaxID=2743358 RepID=A0A843SDQ4_9BURK|nr:hypothetical protein [Rugamonas rivuli]